MEKLSFHESTPWCQKGCGPLLSGTSSLHDTSSLAEYSSGLCHTGRHRARGYRGYDREAEFQVPAYGRRADELKPGDWISVPLSFPLHPMMGIGPHHGFRMVAYGQGSPWGLILMRISVLLSVVCAPEAAGGEKIFQIFGFCCGGRIWGNGDRTNISQASGVLHKRAPEGPCRPWGGVRAPQTPPEDSGMCTGFSYEEERPGGAPVLSHMPL